MKLIKLILAISLLSVAGLGNAWADRGHGHVHGHGHERSGVHFGVVIGPYWGPWFSPMPSSYYYSPPYPRTVVVERYEPPVYIERQTPTTPSIAAVPAPAQQTNYWYYCGASQAYYPYVQACPGGWQKVSPQPLGLP